MEKTEFTINLYKDHKICINKPLIPLKAVLFCWYGAGSFLTPFITVYFKQRGITLSELSTAYVVAPAAQLSGTLLSGIIADKIGRAKPVLVANLILTILMIVCILSIPRSNTVECSTKNHTLVCQAFNSSNITSKYESGSNSSGQISCYVNCPFNQTKLYKEQNIASLKLNEMNDVETNFSICDTDLNSLENKTVCKCVVTNYTSWEADCTVKSSKKCFNENEKKVLNMVTMMFYMFLMVVYSNCYRFLDVTAMYLVEEHKSDFGRERFFSIAGSLIVSPLAGYLVKVTTNEGDENNYNAAFYLFISLIILILIIVYKLDVRINPPGKKMVKKSIILLKNPDVLSFALVVLVLGTAWSFTTKFLFWYLEDLKVPSVLIGLIPAAGALYGLPFLMTSNWWMKKIGTSNMFVLGLLGYVFYSIGYSFLSNPWYSLILEAFTVVTYHLLWVAVVLRSHELAPEGLTATVISMAGSIHYHIGKSCGSLIGGIVMNNYNGKVAFQVVAGICLVCAISYTFYLYYRRKHMKPVLVIHEDRTEEA